MLYKAVIVFFMFFKERKLSFNEHFYWQDVHYFDKNVNF